MQSTELSIYGKGADLGHLCSVHRLHSVNATSYWRPLVHFIHIYANQIIFKSILLLKYCFLWPLCKGHCPQGPGRARHTCASHHQSLSSSLAHLCSSLALQRMKIMKTLPLLNAYLCFSKAVSNSLAHLCYLLALHGLSNIFIVYSILSSPQNGGGRIARAKY